MLMHFQKKERRKCISMHFAIPLSFHCVLSELLRLQAPRPQVEEELPAVMRAEEQLTRLDREVVGMTPSKVMDPCMYIMFWRDWMGFGSLKTDG